MTAPLMPPLNRPRIPPMIFPHQWRGMLNEFPDMKPQYQMDGNEVYNRC